ncbi:MAG: LysR family transcriptional regulator [bacterium]|nr:LysR family transcriptional regulator [bacterium]
MNVSLESLRTLCAIVEAGSFRAAALRLHRSQPAVSQQMKNLEQTLGHTFIERRGCRLTPLGERLYRRARHILTETESLTRELNDFDEAQGQELRVGTSDTTALYLLPPVVREFSRVMPKTRLVITNRPSTAVAEQVLRDELDLGIVTLPMRDEQIEERDLFEQQLVLVTPSKHPLAKRRTVDLDSLGDEPFLLLHGDTRTGEELRTHFRTVGFEPLVVLDTGSFEVIKRYVAEGVGVSIMPDTAITSADRSLATVSVTGLPRIRIGAVWHRHAYQTKGARRFLELVTEAGSGN